jgi:hypothetical protein
MPNFPITNAYRERYQQPPMMQQGQPSVPGQMPQPNPMAMQYANPNARFLRSPGQQMGQGQPGMPAQAMPQGVPQQAQMGNRMQGPMSPYLARLMAFRG